MSKPLRERLTGSLAKRFNRLSYYAKPEGEWIRLDNQKKFDADKLTLRFAVVVLNRALYTERTLTFPITNYLELYRFLKRKYPTEQGYIFTIDDIQGSDRVVRLFSVKQPTLLTKAKFSIVIPESVLYAMSLQPMSGLEINTPNKPLFVVSKADGSVDSVNRSPLMPTLERFMLATGLPDTSTTNIHNDAFTLIYQNLGKAMSRYAMSLATRKQTERKPLNLKPVAITFSAVVVGYFLLTSAYLWGVDRYYQSQVAQDQDKINQLFDQQQQLQAANTQLQSMSHVLSSMTNPAAAWQLLYEFDENGAGIEEITWENGRVLVRGSTVDGATQLLNQLAEQEMVQRATFEAPIRRRGSRENYRIAIELKGMSRGS